MTVFTSAEYIMRNTGLEETQAGIKIAERNINNFRYADDKTFMAEPDNPCANPHLDTYQLCNLTQVP